MEQPELTGSLSLEEVLAAVLLQNPEMAMYSHETRMMEARLLQARKLSNPFLELGIDELNRGGEGFNSSELGISIGQLFELGGKRGWRTRVAEAEGEVADQNYERVRLKIFTTTAQRFVEAVVADRRLELTQSTVALLEELHRAVTEQVKAGKEVPLQAMKAAAELELARLEELDAQNEWGVARKKLAAMWGMEQVTFSEVEGTLDRVAPSIPDRSSLRPRLSMNPELARADAKIRLYRAALASEKASRVPDVEAAVGYTKHEEDGSDSFALGVGVALPLFDRNPGGIAAAEAALAKAEVERTATELGLVMELTEVHAQCVSAHRRVMVLQSSVLPSMEKALDAANAGYREGKTGFLDLLDSQRGLYGIRGELLDALSEYHTAMAELQGLTGLNVEELQRPNQGETE